MYKSNTLLEAAYNTLNEKTQDLLRLKVVNKSLLKARSDKANLDKLIMRTNKNDKSYNKLKVNSDNLKQKIDTYMTYWKDAYNKPISNEKDLERMISAIGKLPTLAKQEDVAKAIA